MERIQAAIQKAKDQRGGPALGATPISGRGRAARGGAGPAWADLPAFEPDPERMIQNRVITFADSDNAHVTFDMMRTKILRTMRQNNWTSIGITSPTAGCGKTTTTLNIAFSLAHQPDVRTVLVDLDLRRPAVAEQLGVTRSQSMAGVLQGKKPIAENFVRYGDNLAIGTNAHPVKNPANILMSATTTQGVTALRSAFQPDILLYDLPPMLQSDDVMAFVQHLDCVLLIAGAEKSRVDEIDKCEQDLAEQVNVLGVVLNMCHYPGEDYGYY